MITGNFHKIEPLHLCVKQRRETLFGQRQWFILSRRLAPRAARSLLRLWASYTATSSELEDSDYRNANVQIPLPPHLWIPDLWEPYPSNKAMQCYTYAVFLSPPSTWALMVHSTGSFLSIHRSESAVRRCFRSEHKWWWLKDTLGAPVLLARASKPLGQSLRLAAMKYKV